jgi:hypothetical protein
MTFLLREVLLVVFSEVFFAELEVAFTLSFFTVAAFFEDDLTALVTSFDFFGETDFLVTDFAVDFLAAVLVAFAFALVDDFLGVDFFFADDFAAEDFDFFSAISVCYPRYPNLCQNSTSRII